MTAVSETGAVPFTERSAQSVSTEKSSEAEEAALPPWAKGLRMRGACLRRSIPFVKASGSPPEAICEWSTVTASFAMSRRTGMVTDLVPAATLFCAAIGMPLEDTEE